MTSILNLSFVFMKLHFHNSTINIHQQIIITPIDSNLKLMYLLVRKI